MTRSKGEKTAGSAFEPEEVYKMYTTTAKILSLHAQGRHGMSELKQMYLPKGNIRAPIVRLLELADMKLADKRACAVRTHHYRYRCAAALLGSALCSVLFALCSLRFAHCALLSALLSMLLCLAWRCDWG